MFEMCGMLHIVFSDASFMRLDRLTAFDAPKVTGEGLVKISQR